MKELVIDAENCVAGRVASSAAKLLLQGKAVKIVNAEKALVSGNPKSTLDRFKIKTGRGDPLHGAFYPKRPERILKRMVRGMIPYKKPMGKKAFKALRVYISVPEELKGRQMQKVFEKKLEASITLEKLSQRL